MMAKLSPAQEEMLVWLSIPGERYVRWGEWKHLRWGARLVDRGSTYPRIPSARVDTAAALLRMGYIAESHRDENGPFCEITAAGRAYVGAQPG
jgi:hypothetical protein